MRTRIDSVDFAVDEHIWGHRLYDEQLPHLTVLEFLNVLGSNRDAPLSGGAEAHVKYRPQRQIRLRSLLFNNPYIEAVRDRQASDAEKWAAWQELYTQNVTGIGDGDLDYLRRVFTGFDDFARAVELLRSTAFEARSNKRWSSKFVFPFGPDALYEDLRIDASGASNDRRFFGRTGELLYLMLMRAARGAELGQVLAERLFDASAPLNRLARALQGDAQYAPDARNVGYLPYSDHPRFNILCDDWLAILSRDIPIYDALDHLITNAGLNLLLYFLTCGKAETGDVEPVEIVCEIISRERTKVRTLSGECYESNQSLSARAVRSSIEAVRSSMEWEDALTSDDPPGQCAQLMRERFQWPPSERDDDGDFEGLSGEELITRLIDAAESRHEQHFAKIHSSWSRSIGLSSRRLSRRVRYAPNDRLLKTLVVSVVSERMQFDEFLQVIYERYGIVVGDIEGERLVRENRIDQDALSDNRDNLERRLLGLGLVRRLSDSCSFVENPFGSKGGL